VVLAKEFVDASAKDDTAPSTKGRIEVVKMLLADLRFDPSIKANEAFCEASENGYADVIKLLVTDPRVHT
jgi:hypothetical protein